MSISYISEWNEVNSNNSQVNEWMRMRKKNMIIRVKVTSGVTIGSEFFIYFLMDEIKSNTFLMYGPMGTYRMQLSRTKTLSELKRTRKIFEPFE